MLLLLQLGTSAAAAAVANSSESPGLPTRTDGVGRPSQCFAAPGDLPLLLQLLLLRLLLLPLLLPLLPKLLLLLAHVFVCRPKEVHETLKAVERLWLRLHSLC